MEIEIHSQLGESKKNIWHSFLHQAGLTADESVEQTVLIWDGNELIATGSRQGNLLKCIAVDPARQGEGLLASVLTALRQEAFKAGCRHLFVYTKPINAPLFTPLFFYPIAQTADVLLMEDRQNGVRDFIAKLPKVPTANAGAAVMNCNPFTLGHQYLIETAARECDHLYIFILSEENGTFTAADRLEMAKQGTAHIPNVTVLPTGPYLISGATFPTYFLKNREQATTIHCQLDIEIFARYFVPAFGIKQRFVGNEPLSTMTNQYNQTLLKMLPPRGVSVCEIARITVDGTPISASAVRVAYEQKDWQALADLVPVTTLNYLKNLT